MFPYNFISSLIQKFFYECCGNSLMELYRLVDKPFNVFLFIFFISFAVMLIVNHKYADRDKEKAYKICERCSAICGVCIIIMCVISFFGVLIPFLIWLIF